MKTRHERLLLVVIVLALGACKSGPEATETSAASSESSPVASSVQDVMQLDGFVDLEPGTYFIDPDADPSTPLRVVYEVPAGWSQWIGAAKFADDGHVGVSITTVTNLVRQACSDHSPADPPVGPSVDDLATALTRLAPFQVTSLPTDTTFHGYRGKHLEWVVPDLPVEGTGDHREFKGCTDGNLATWMAPYLGPPGDNAFYGYNAEPGFAEEFWILDVDGTRLVIEANRSRKSPRTDVAEMRAILDSIQIKP
jgi:hypothetical protein